LLNRQLAGETVDPEEALEVLEEIESVVIGDVDTCRRKIQRYKSIGVDRLMCLMSFGFVSQEHVLRSMRMTGTYLIPELCP
jgi:alkanesulfonate monooxygenase SsuD/methylene tetrahydromethanopterin reductase-like flavin-dependent oxidoreductase (luciferase family)